MFLHLSYPRCMNAASSTQTFRLKGNTNLGLAWIYIHFRKNEIDWSTGHIRLNGRSPMYEIHGTKSCIYTWLLWNIHYIYLMDWSKLLAIWYRLTEILPRAKAVSSQITIAINGSKERDSCKLEVNFFRSEWDCSRQFSCTKAGCLLHLNEHLSSSIIAKHEERPVELY